MGYQRMVLVTMVVSVVGRWWFCRAGRGITHDLDCARPPAGIGL